MSSPSRSRSKVALARAKAASPVAGPSRGTRLGIRNTKIDAGNTTKETPGPSSRFVQENRQETHIAGQAEIPGKQVGVSAGRKDNESERETTDYDDIFLSDSEENSQVFDKSDSSSSGDEYKYSPLRRRPPGPNGTPPPTFAQICKAKGVPLTLLRKQCRLYVRQGFKNVWWDAFVPPPQYKDEIFEELSQTPPKDPALDVSSAYYLSMKPKKKIIDKAEQLEREKQSATKLLKLFEENKQRRIEHYKELGIRIPSPLTSPRNEAEEVVPAPTPKKSPGFPDDSFNDELLLEYSEAVEKDYHCTRTNTETVSSSNRENESNGVPQDSSFKKTSKKGLLQEILAPVDSAALGRNIVEQKSGSGSKSTRGNVPETPKSSSRRRGKATTQKSTPTKRIKLPSPDRVLPQPRQLNFSDRDWKGNEFDDDDLLLSQIEIPGEVQISQNGEKLTATGTEGEGFDGSDSDDDLFSQIDY